MAILMSDRCEQGVKLLWYQGDQKKFPEGIAHLEAAIKDGDPEAYYFLSRLYAWGDANTREDDKKAYELCKKGASLGSLRALVGVQRMLKYDVGIRTVAKYTLEDAFEQLKGAAIAGDAFSAYQVGCAYYWGDVHWIHGASDPAESNCIKWYEMAAQGGLMMGMKNLACCYFNGEYVEKSDEKGYYWSRMAADLGDPWGLYNSGIFARNNGNFPQAVSYLQEASDKGQDNAPYALGLMYADGRADNGRINMGKALELYQIAAERGEEAAERAIGRIYFFGKGGVPEDYEKAFHWLGKCAARGDISVYGDMGWMYLNGKGCERNDEKALEYFTTLSQNETNGYGNYQLGWMHEKGRCVPQDYAKAVEYYTASANMGDKDAKERLTHFKKGLFGKWKLI